MSCDATRHTVRGMNERSPSQRFIDSLAMRDFDAMAAVVSPGARARLLLPRGPEEQEGRDAIIRRVQGWFGPASHFEVLDTTDAEIGGRRRLSWRIRVVRDGGGPEVVEQLAFVDIGPGGIERLDLLCSGFQREESAACERAVFDAGSLGCSDGLAEEFRRQIAGVPVGTSLVVVVADPAAKEDLPPLARMLGHTVRSTQALGDGRLTFTVERRK